MCAYSTIKNKSYYKNVKMILCISTSLYMYLLETTVILYC